MDVVAISVLSKMLSPARGTRVSVAGASDLLRIIFR